MTQLILASASKVRAKMLSSAGLKIDVVPADINEEVIKKAVQFGIAINGKVSEYSIFARKSYFYPDLPKNYQISQYELPIIEGGNINIIDKTGKEKLIKITRDHLEEDAGK